MAICHAKNAIKVHPILAIKRSISALRPIPALSGLAEPFPSPGQDIQIHAGNMANSK
jgi:hypothetical protein